MKKIFAVPKTAIPYLLNLYVKLRNRLNKALNKPTMFIYTDSRGQYVTDKYHYYKGIFPFYAFPFLKKYHIKYYACPLKHTTVADFIATLKATGQEFDVVIAHIGIVDFSPRHKSSTFEIYDLKKPRYDKIFGLEKMKEHLNTDLGVEYEGVVTNNMFSKQMAEQDLVPYLKNIPNLIFVGCNNFVRGWEGNYFRKRPKNIYIVEEYSNILCKALPNVVDLSVWSDEEVMRFTMDNIHFTKKGGNEIFTLLQNTIEKLRD